MRPKVKAFSTALLFTVLLWVAELHTAFAQAPNLSEGGKVLAITGIKQYSEVLDAAITQKGSTLSLVLVVRRGTSKTQARSLGDSFVRMVKTFARAESPPQKEIGTGVYDYIIGVFYPDQTEVVLGGKVSFSPRITW